MEIYVEVSLICIFSLFYFFNSDFIIFIDFTRIAASNTATSQVRSHIEYLIQTYNAHFIIKNDEKSSLNDGLLIRLNDDS